MGYTSYYDTLMATSTFSVFMETSSYMLPDCVVTGKYDSIHQDDAVQKVVIIDSKKIEAMSAVTLNEVLANEMNIRISQDNILGSSMTMQGISGENVKILIDGVPVVGRLEGSIDLSQINLNDVDRIEIIEGPQSVSYGTNALSGTINIITKKDQKKRIELAMKTYYENLGRYNIDGKIGFKSKRHYLSVSGGRNYFDGWME
jgi:outer membrane receptor for ferrienterochelin and colicins